MKYRVRLLPLGVHRGRVDKKEKYGLGGGGGGK